LGVLELVATQTWWWTPVLSGIFALTGVLIAQSIVLYLARRTNRRRSDIELLKHCALFSAACGRLERELALKTPNEWDYKCLDDLEAASDAINISAPPEIEKAAEHVVGWIPLAIEEQSRREIDQESNPRRLRRTSSLHRCSS
jgi:undecaprenyl pyrophosphate synthase